MRYNRTIHISTGNSRKDTAWKTAEYTLEDFYARLTQVERTQETLGVFLDMTKARQDELKDIGGFVGGALNGRRIVKNLRGRDLIALDMDNIPSGKTDEVERKLLTLGCGYAFYTTRKHQPSAPRIRVVVPLNRTVSVEEYEPIARELAHMIQPEMNWFDPTTFEVTRLMYWPSCSVDSVFLSKHVDKPLLDADGMLKRYNDWHDISSWPVVPGAEAKQIANAKKKDPTERTDEIGAFCKAYPISSAISTFLPGVYTNAGEGRYTFTEGSTTGGAVVYDDMFLFSHHATDPCSGKEVNAFDLVREHRFGHMDEDAKQGTPFSKLPSQQAMRAFVREDLVCQDLLSEWAAKDYGLRLQGNQELGSNKTFHRFQADNEKKDLTVDLVSEMLRALEIELSYNEITHETIAQGVESLHIRPADAENYLAPRLADFFRVMKVKGATKTNIQDHLGLIASSNRINPVKDMILNTSWDGADRISVLYEIMGGLQSFERVLVRKWLLQCIALAFNRDVDDFPYGADGVLVLSGAQGIGKTSLVRRLAVSPVLFQGGASLSFRDKDTLINATSGWITELGEMERTVREDEAALKAFITSESDKIRLPYARAPVKQVRRTSFCGTVNSNRFLRDETGNRRFWTVGVDRIDLEKLWGLSENWFIQLWAQVYKDWRAEGVDSFRLTREEQEALSAVNSKRMEERPGEQEIRDLLEPDLPEDQWSKVSATQIATLLGGKYPAITIGKILNTIVDSGDYFGAKKIRSNRRREYLLPISKEINLI
ncbi:MAG: VapE family protein [Eubacteriales bacterium]|nr:VapE family protein [Eubacteriales bacterium]